MNELLFIRNEVTPAMIRGVWMSLRLIVPSAVFGLMIGIVTGILRVYGLINILYGIIKRR
jgi:polar amino acid transport system permease protein